MSCLAPADRAFVPGFSIRLAHSNKADRFLGFNPEVSWEFHVAVTAI